MQKEISNKHYRGYNIKGNKEQKTSRKKQQNKNVVFKMINKIGKSLARLMKKKSENTQIIKSGMKDDASLPILEK